VRGHDAGRQADVYRLDADRLRTASLVARVSTSALNRVDPADQVEDNRPAMMINIASAASPGAVAGDFSQVDFDIGRNMSL
jgi:hypothetical protein